jgi:hypothetical protein
MIVDTNVYYVTIDTGDSDSLKGYFKDAGQGECIPKTLKDPNKPGDTYTITDLYVNSSDQVVVSVGGAIDGATDIEVTFEINDPCQAPITVTCTDNTLGDYVGSNGELFGLLKSKDAVNVQIKPV